MKQIIIVFFFLTQTKTTTRGYTDQNLEKSNGINLNRRESNELSNNTL